MSPRSNAAVSSHRPGNNTLRKIPSADAGTASKRLWRSTNWSSGKERRRCPENAKGTVTKGTSFRKIADARSKPVSKRGVLGASDSLLKKAENDRDVAAKRCGGVQPQAGEQYASQNSIGGCRDGVEAAFAQHKLVKRERKEEASIFLRTVIF